MPIVEPPVSSASIPGWDGMSLAAGSLFGRRAGAHAAAARPAATDA